MLLFNCREKIDLAPSPRIRKIYNTKFRVFALFQKEFRFLEVGYYYFSKPKRPLYTSRPCQVSPQAQAKKKPLSQRRFYSHFLYVFFVASSSRTFDPPFRV